MSIPDVDKKECLYYLLIPIILYVRMCYEIAEYFQPQS